MDYQNGLTDKMQQESQDVPPPSSSSLFHDPSSSSINIQDDNSGGDNRATTPAIPTLEIPIVVVGGDEEEELGGGGEKGKQTSEDTDVGDSKPDQTNTQADKQFSTEDTQQQSTVEVETEKECSEEKEGSEEEEEEEAVPVICVEQADGHEVLVPMDKLHDKLLQTTEGQDTNIPTEAKVSNKRLKF